MTRIRGLRVVIILIVLMLGLSFAVGFQKYKEINSTDWMKIDIMFVKSVDYEVSYEGEDDYETAYTEYRYYYEGVIDNTTYTFTNSGNMSSTPSEKTRTIIVDSSNYSHYMMYSSKNEAIRETLSKLWSLIKVLLIVIVVCFVIDKITRRTLINHHQ